MIKKRIIILLFALVSIVSGFFFKANQIFFIFIDKNGESLVDLNNHTFFPVSFTDSLSEIITSDGDLKIDINKLNERSFLFNRNRDEINIHKDGLITWNTAFIGNLGCEKSQMYVRLTNTDIDTIKINYRFLNSNGEADGPKNYAEIDSLFYNNTVIIGHHSKRGNTFHDKVFIKKVGNSTIISFEK